MSVQKQTWNELCATFSVRDHKNPGAFIAEVLLYDRLVIPVPPKDGDHVLKRDGDKISTRFISKEEADIEWARWKSLDWEPDLQAEILEILKKKLNQNPYDPRIIEVPWTMELQKEWQQRMENGSDTPETVHGAVESAVKQARRNGYFETAGILEKFAPAMAKTVAAVASFRSLEDLQKRIVIRDAPPERFGGQNLMAVLGFELFVPNDPNRNHTSLLSEAAEVASDADYRTKRTALYHWQQRYIGDGVTDAHSVSKAVDDMRELVGKLKVQDRWKWVKQVVSFFPLVGSVVKVAFPAASGGADVFASVGELASDHANGEKEPDLFGKPAAALVLDAQKRLGLTMDKCGQLSLKFPRN